MMITKMALPRRMFLRGIGASLALPLLDAMVPALSAFAKTAAKPANRLGFIYVPNGAVMSTWTPEATGRAFELADPGAARSVPRADARGQRTRPNAGELLRRCGRSLAWNSRVAERHPCQTDRRGRPAAGITADQIAAREFGRARSSHR
jgi:hypothetical protein